MKFGGCCRTEQQQSSSLSYASKRSKRGTRRQPVVLTRGVGLMAEDLFLVLAIACLKSRNGVLPQNGSWVGARVGELGIAHN